MNAASNLPGAIAAPRTDLHHMTLSKLMWPKNSTPAKIDIDFDHDRERGLRGEQGDGISRSLPVQAVTEVSRLQIRCKDLACDGLNRAGC